MIYTLKATMDKGFQGIPVGVDLNAVNHIGHVYGIEDSGGADVHRQDPVRPDYGLSSMEHFFSHCGSLWWRPSCSYIALRRAISNNVVFSTYLSGESPRYRSLFVGAGRKTLSHGSAGTRQSFASGRRQTISRLGHLRRLRSKTDRSSKKALCRGELRGRHLQYRLCSGCHNYRSLPVDVSLGSLSNRQGCRKSSYADGPQGFYPKLYSYLRWQTPRCQCSRSTYPRSWCLLCDGSGVSRLRASVCPASGQQFLRHSSQIQSGCQKTLFRFHRSNHRSDLRSDHCSEWFLQPPPLSSTSTSNPFQGRRVRQNIVVSHQSSYLASINHMCTIQEPLADRTVLQMDQATSSYKAFLRRFRKCRQITNLDRRFRLCSYRYHQEKAQSRCFALYIVTDPIGHHLRENALAASLSRKWNSIKYYGKS